MLEANYHKHSHRRVTSHIVPPLKLGSKQKNRRQKHSVSPILSRRDDSVRFISVRFQNQQPQQPSSPKKPSLTGRQSVKLPHIRYKPSQQGQTLEKLGYSCDLRLHSEIYSDKIEQNKSKFLNKMQAMQLKLNHSLNKYEQNQLRVKILEQKQQRMRQNQSLMRMERKERIKFHKMLQKHQN